ncbi:protein translocase subunit SecF [Streptomyces sodiiphilus]|uniref:Protein-export membrane protein SecF n=1 Tax=Streptomyces sodiiphilus TaxID=226217 RepID=A0ABN2NRC1_9ACTN
MSRLGSLGSKLYRGETAYDFVGKRKLWYGVTLAFVVIALSGLGLRGLNMGVEFQGGAVFTTPPAVEMTVEEAREVTQEASGSQARVQRMGDGALRIQVTGLDTEQSNETREVLAGELGIPVQELSTDLVGPSWGDQMSSKALQGLVVFLILVTLYLAIAFEWRMSMAALVAVLHDLVITVGVYAIVGFEVTPGTVVGVLTVLSYSLYDTVVVFDKVKEKTQNVTKQSRRTYGELANLGLNATLVRSVNTSVVALLPVGALLFIGTGLLGGGMLKDIALSLFIGLAAGTYSSIMIATPLVTDFKLRDREIRAHDKRILAKREAAAQAAATGAENETGDDDSGAEDAGATTASTVVGPRRQPASRNRGRGRPSGKRR